MGYKRDDLADKVGITTTFLADIENGSKGMGMDTLYWMADALLVTTDYLLKGNPDDDASPLITLSKRCSKWQNGYLIEMASLFAEAMNRLDKEQDT